MGDSEQSFAFVSQLSSLFNAHPLLWTVYGFVIMLPALFIIAYFWPKKKIDASAQRKKTDAPTPDDNVSSSETRKEKPIITSGKDRQRDGPVTSARREQEDESSTRQTQPNRTQADSGLKRTTVNPAAEVQSAREDQGEEVPDTRLGNETAVVSNGTLDDITTKQAKASAESATVHNGGIVENGYHDDEPVIENGIDHQVFENGEDGRKRWSFPPVLDDFNLMESEVDPAELEAIFADDRLKEIELHIQPDSPGLGISIVGGSGSPSGDLPILIKRILPNSLAEQDGRLKQSDELVAVNDALLVGMSKDFAINALSNMHGDVRLLVLQEY